MPDARVVTLAVALVLFAHCVSAAGASASVSVSGSASGSASAEGPAAFEARGVPVDSGDEPADAAVLRQGGQYVDTLPTGRAPRYYRVERSEPGSTIHVGATTRTVRTGYSSLHVRAETAAGERCGDSVAIREERWGGRSLVSAAVSTWEADQGSACATADEIIVMVSQNSGNLGGVPVEIVVYEEPPLASGTSVAPAQDGAPWIPVRDAPAASGVEPGAGVTDAPVLDPGRYDLRIGSGQTQVVAVPLGWGQRLQFQAVSAPLAGALDSGTDVTTTFHSTIIGPLRAATSPLLDTGQQPDWADIGAAVEPGRRFTTGGATPTVSYLNRSDATVAAAALPGLRFIEISFGGGQGAGDVELPYTLTVEIIDTPGDHEPTYHPDTRLVTPVPPPPDMVARRPGGEGDDDRSESDSGTSRPLSTQPATPSSTQPSAPATPVATVGTPSLAGTTSGGNGVPVALALTGLALICVGASAVVRAVRTTR